MQLKIHFNFSRLKERIKKILLPALLILVFAAGIIGGYFYFESHEKNEVFKKDIYANFAAEVYETVKNNYWEKISDDELSDLFRLGAEKITSLPQILDPANEQGVEKIVLRITKDMPTDKKKDFSVSLANIVLTNLKPFNRSQLYSQKQTIELSQNVRNINPQTGKTEPTVFSNLITPDILHLRLTKLSPQSFDEFQKAADEIDKTSSPTSLILDLRGNVGGDIDLLQYFLGPFIGENQYAYEFFHQGDYKPFKTSTGWLSSLVRYKKVVILVDKETQSSAELMASVLKKYNVGILMGKQTKGWGTVENTFPIKQQLDVSEKYSVFLAHSLTIADDNQPIEGRGVAPVIGLDNPDWQKELLAYFNYQPLITAIQTILNEK